MMVKLMDGSRSGEMRMARGDRRGSRWHVVGLLDSRSW